MSRDLRSRSLAFFLLGLMALLVAPRDLFHQCGTHEHASLAATDHLQLDEDCAICKAVVGHVVPAGSEQTPLVHVFGTPGPVCTSIALVAAPERACVPRGPPALS